MLSGLLVLCVGSGALVAARWLYFLVAVHGGSMLPTLRPGDRVLVRRVRRQRLRVGDIVVCRHYIPTSPQPSSAPPQPSGGSGPPTTSVPAWVIKRVAAVPGDPVPPVGIPEVAQVVPAGAVVLLGDNPAASADSRDAGFFRLDRVRGKVIRRLSWAA
jgi:signal peptidase I